MKKSDLITAIAQETNQPENKVALILGGLMNVTFSQIGMGSEITIPGIIKLSVVGRAARTARNPQTGEPIQVPAKNVVRAKVLKALANNVPS